MVAARQWRLLVHDRCLFVAAACSWQRLVHCSCSSISVAHSGRWLVNGGSGLSMAAVACLWQQWPVYGSSGLSMAAVACLWQQLVHGGGLFIEATYLWRLCS
jgi:hypothetical protein